MALFGSSRDISFIHSMNNEFMNNVVQQEVHYFKLALAETKSKDTANLYGEASAQKTYYNPIRLSCLIDRTQGEIANADDQFGMDISSAFIFRFLRLHLEQLQLVAEIGDIIEDRGNYYEIDNISELQFVGGLDNEQPKSVGAEFGKSLSLECTAHLARISRLQIEKNRR